MCKTTVFQLCGECNAVTRHDAMGLKSTAGTEMFECIRCGGCRDLAPAMVKAASLKAGVPDSVRVHGLRELRLVKAVELPSLKGCLKAAEWAALHGTPAELRDAMKLLDEVALSISNVTALLAGREVE